MKLRSYHLLALLGLLAATATGCVPTYRLSVQPGQLPPGRPGRADYAEASADSVGMALRFVAYEPEWLVFEAEYHNDSRRPVSIDPAAFAQAPGRRAGVAEAGQRVRRGERVSAAVAAASRRAPWPALPAAPQPAFDPLAGADLLQQRADAEARRVSRVDWLGVALVAVSLGADLAGAAGWHETPAQYQTRAVLHEAAWGYQAVSSANRLGHAAQARQLTWRATQLRDFGLRPTRLQPGQQLRGYVFLPRFDDADHLRVLAPLGRGRVALDFEQLHQRR